MSELIDRVLKSSKHEEQSYNACAGILHMAKTVPYGMAEEAARKCIEMNSEPYQTIQTLRFRLRMPSDGNSCRL